MTPAETAAFLRQFNEWRRGDEDIPQPDPRVIGEAIDAAVEMIDRLEAAEKERDALRVELNEIRYWTAVAHDTIKALNARIEAAENDAAHQKALAASALRVAEGWERKCGELRAKIAEMEQQAPVMWANSSNINSSRINKERGGSGDQHTCSETQTAYHHAPLYALPGAKGE